MTGYRPYSDLILAGSQGNTQEFEHYYRAEGGQIVGTCAVGAARLAYSGEPAACVWPHEDQMWTGPTLKCEGPHTYGEPPWHSCLCRRQEEPHFHLKSVVIHLNDCLRWPREKIAEYIASYGY